MLVYVQIVITIQQVKTMDYPRVLGSSIDIMPPKKRSMAWFNQQPSPVQLMFWHTLAKFNIVVAAEYLRDNCLKVAVPKPTAAVRTKEQDAKIVTAFSKPLASSGTVIGEMWPGGINILFPIPRYYSYSRFTSGWAYIGAVTTCKGDRMTYPSCSAAVASQKALKAARRFARNGHAIEHIKAELFELRLEQVEMIGKTRKCA